MNDSVSLSPKYISFKCDGRSFNSNVGACTTKSNIIFSVLMDKETNLRLPLCRILERDSKDAKAISQ